MALCSFCGAKITPGTGKLFVKNDGKTFTFCSRRCERNLLELKRKARETPWTREARKVKEGRR